MAGPFVATHYKGKPAVYDTVARVMYMGYKSMTEARNRAEELNLSPASRETCTVHTIRGGSK